MKAWTPNQLPGGHSPTGKSASEARLFRSVDVPMAVDGLFHLTMSMIS